MLGESDGLFGWSTVAFNTSGVTDDRSLYLSAVVKQLRENPRRDLPLPLVSMLELTNGDMQRELAVLLAARPLPASSRKRPVGGGAHEACTGSVEQVVNCRLAGETPPRSRA